MKNEPLKKVLSLVSKCTSIPKKQITLKTCMEDHDKWDSVSHVKIILELEKYIGKIKTSEFYQLNSVEKIIKKFKKKY